MSTPIRAPLLALLTALLGTNIAVAQEHATSDRQPSQVIDALNACLSGVMKDAETLGYRGRFDRLSPVVRDLFDLDFMAQKIVGRHWKTASPEDQERIVDTFSRYTISNYAGRFSGWSGQEFQRLGEEPSARGTVLVRTKLLDPEGNDVELDYRLRHTDAGGWQIIDIYFNGTVSELALRRSEYSSLIKREGLEALLAALDERIAELAVTPADQG